MSVINVKRTIKSLSVKEANNKKKLEFMIPMGIPGRFQLMTKLKDLVINVDYVVVRPIQSIPSIINNVVDYFSTDGYWVGNFMAYGSNLMGEKTLLWDDIEIDMKRSEGTLHTDFITERLSNDESIVIVTSKKHGEQYSLEFYCYLPQ